MPHQVLDRHLAFDGGALETDFLILERGDVFRHGIGQQQPAFFVEGERGHGDDGLRHRGDPEDRVGGHRRAGRLVSEADGLQVRHAALARHEDDGAGDAAALDVGAQDLRDAVQALRREPDLLGLGRREVGGDGGRDDQQPEEQGDERSRHHDAPPGVRTSAPGAASSSHAFTVMESML